MGAAQAMEVSTTSILQSLRIRTKLVSEQVTVNQESPWKMRRNDLGLIDISYNELQN